jgi:DNA replication protein DnaC
MRTCFFWDYRGGQDASGDRVDDQSVPSRVQGLLYDIMDTLMRKIKKPQPRHKAYLTCSLMVVDEVGYLPIDSREAYLFFQCVSYRYERSSTILTSNKSFSVWQELFGDPVIATTMLDRLLHLL